MKSKTFTQWVLLSILLLMGGNLYATDVTTTFKAGSNYTAGMTLPCENGGLDWVSSGKPQSFENASPNRGIQYSKTTTDLTTTIANANVTKVVVIASTNANANVNNISVYIGQTQLGSTQNMPKANNQTFTFENTTGLSGEIKVSMYNNGEKSTYIKSIAVTYTTTSPTATLSSIAVSGQTTTFTVGDTFSFGGTVTATYDDNTTADVTNNANFSGYNLSTTGNQTVTVSYTENNVTKTATYQITVNPAPDPSDLALTGAPVELSFDLYNNSSAQTVSYTTSSTGAVTVSGGDGYVTTSVSGTTITVTPVAVTPSAQTITITVSQAADATYAAGTATFTVTVTDSTPASAYEWVEAAITDLTTSDIFVIVGTVGNDTYAMTNDNGSNSAPATSSVTISGDKITSTVANNIKWNISGNATTGYSFNPNGDSEHFLYCTTNSASGNNNNIRVGTSQYNRQFFVLNSNNYLITKDSYTTRYLSIYTTNSDWRGYVNTSNNPATIKFYKRTTVDTSTPRITADNVGIAYNATSGTITYSIENPVTGGAITASCEDNWITSFGTPDGTSISFVTTANSNFTARTATVTLTYTYNNQTVTKNVTITQAALL